MGRKEQIMEEQQLREKIIENLEIILQKREGDLASATLSLDSLKSAVSGHLSHYLTKRSYEKAWILLNGDDPEKGVCH